MISSSSMKVLHGPWRTAFLIFFISHIPITILIDSQGAFGSGVVGLYYPQPIRQLVQWYIVQFGDVLMKGPPSSVPWFASIICCEMLFQVPFFIIAIHMLLVHTQNSQQNYYPNWFKTLCLLYGSHVSTTLIPILATFIESDEMTSLQKIMTISIYSPYLIFPLVLLYFAAKHDVIVAVQYFYEYYFVGNANNNDKAKSQSTTKKDN